MGYRNVNLNTLVKIKMSEKGMQYYVHAFNELHWPLQLSAEDIMEKTSLDGFYTLPFHSLMNIFGGLGRSLFEYIYMDIFVETQ